MSLFPDDILDWIQQENLWNLWVPKKYGGREETLTEGLQKLKKLANIDGSLGWTITLCSGANFFIGNLKKEVAAEIFLNTKNPILGGSGGAFGTAEKTTEGYRISGTWKYATGAPYLTHFTLNTRIISNGKEVKEADGKPKVKSFIIPKNKVRVIPDWNTMGLKATATHSFSTDIIVEEKYSFEYNQYHLDQNIFKVPFSLFADLTLWVNYLGMAKHFVEEAQEIISQKILIPFIDFLSSVEIEIMDASEETERIINSSSSFSDGFLKKTHNQASGSVSGISRHIINVYPHLGIKGSSKNQPINQVFRDYFTATQHNIFLP